VTLAHAVASTNVETARNFFLEFLPTLGKNVLTVGYRADIFHAYLTAVVRNHQKEKVMVNTKLAAAATKLDELVLYLEDSAKNAKWQDALCDNDVIEEAKHVLSLFMEEGHSNYERLHDSYLYGPEDRKQARKEVQQLKVLIKRFHTAN
jgi:hypothetical protein